MKVIVCADSHGAFAAAERLLEQNREAAAVIFLGDGAEEWEDLCAIYPQTPFYPVRGNCDWGSDWPAVRVVELGGHRLFCTHGHLYGVKSGDMGPLLRAAKAENCDIVLYGHTHAAGGQASAEPREPAAPGGGTARVYRADPGREKRGADPGGAEVARI